MFRPQRTKKEFLIKKKQYFLIFQSAKILHVGWIKWRKEETMPSWFVSVCTSVEGMQKAYILPFLVHMLFRIYWPFWNFDEEFQISHTPQMPYIYNTYRLQNVETDYKRICEVPILKEEVEFLLIWESKDSNLLAKWSSKISISLLSFLNNYFAKKK